MNCLVTGAAGFIGSHLSEGLLALGHNVLGIDCFTDYYPLRLKEANLSRLRQTPGFTFLEANLNDIDLRPILQGVESVFHHAAQAGVRPSWGQNFAIYVGHNILATQHLLEAAVGADLKKIVYASSSSVYGDTDRIPMCEDIPLHPVSPYGVTKLAAEDLCYLYWKNYGLPVISLRYFTVFGPRQRPDMAFNKFIRATLEGRPITIFGDGKQTRDFTYVSDAVAANIQALESNHIGEVYNIGGGARITVNELLSILEGVTGIKPRIKYEAAPKGEMQHTLADVSKARRELGYNPQVKVPEGLALEAAWIKEVG